MIGAENHHLGLAVAVVPAADTAGLGLAGWADRRAGLLTLLYAAAVLGVLAAGGQHRLRICLRVSDQAGRIVMAAVLVLPGLLPWLPATAALRLTLWGAGLLLACRAAAYAAVRAGRRHGWLAEPALLVGSGVTAVTIAGLARAHPELGLRLRGFLGEGPPRGLALPCLGRPAEVGELAGRLGIRRVIVCWHACRDEDLVTALRRSRPQRADVCVVPRLYELAAALPRSCLDEVWGIPLIPLRRAAPRRALLVLKRAFDVAAAAVALVAALPLLAAAGLAIRLASGPPVLCRQARVTGAGRVTSILKLRTLPGQPGPDTCWSVPPGECSRLGRFLRATHLDELPQLINVIRGDMSLAGPRPERPYFAERFGRDVPGYAGRTRMRAGLSGWAQVHGLTGDTSIAERARFDNYYIEYWSPWLDLVILARTLAAAIPRPARATPPGNNTPPALPAPAPAPAPATPAAVSVLPAPARRAVPSHHATDKAADKGVRP
jgi:lipopolysaccharide/colanic/teichoic acid biosynthesis glycosyltransferase